MFRCIIVDDAVVNCYRLVQLKFILLPFPVKMYTSAAVGAYLIQRVLNVFLVSIIDYPLTMSLWV